MSSNPAVLRLMIYLQERKMDQLLRAPSVGKHSSARVDEEERAEISSRSNRKARTVVGRGAEEPAMTSDLTYDWEGEREGRRK